VLNATETISDEEKKSEVLVSMASALSQVDGLANRESLFRKVLAVAKSEMNSYRKSISLSSIASALAEAGYKGRAQHCFRETLNLAKFIRDSEHKSAALLPIALSVAQMDGLGNRESLFQEVLKAAEMNGDDDEKFEVSLAIAVAVAKADDLKNRESLFQQALTLAEAIRDPYYKSGALASIATALAEAGEIERALTIAESESLRVIGGESARLPPIGTALASIATALAETGEIERALTIAASIRDMRGKSGALASIATALAEAGEIERALTVTDLVRNAIERELTGTGLVRNAIDRSEAVSSIASVMAQAGGLASRESLFPKALNLAESIQLPHCKLSALSSIALALAQTDGLDNRDILFEAVLSAVVTTELESWDYSGLKTETLSSIASSLTEGGYSDQAVRFLQEAFKAAETIGKASDRCNSLSTIASAIAQAGDEDLFNKYFKDSKLQQGVLTKVVPDWLEALIEYQPSRMDLLRKSMCHCILDKEMAYEGAYHFIHGLILNKKLKTVSAIVRKCPQLGLDFLLDAGEPKQTYDNLDEWIDDLKNEDDQGKIMLWEREVEKGKMTVETFDRKVADLL
jgi:tetratricopeptide (TPR) repeat protein